MATGDKSANKNINTKNYELFQTSNLREWYERHVIEPTLTSLDKFQEQWRCPESYNKHQ